MLEAHSVSRHFGGIKAVDGVSLSVARGEIAGLIGPNGAGKTTMLENLLLAAPRQLGERILPNWFLSARVRREERRNLEKAAALLDFVDLGRLARAPARTLSGGQRKLLELARVLMADPQIVLLDEPAAGVNPTLLETIIARIADLNRKGITFLIIEHNMDLIARLCRKVIVMAGGRFLCEGTPQQVAGDPRVIDAYLGGAPP